MSYEVYKVTGPNTSHCYYGYASKGAAQATFNIGAKRKTGDRGDIKMFEANLCDLGSLAFEVVQEFDSEQAAFIGRNDMRSTDGSSITGPTNWPNNMARIVAAANPDVAERWSLNLKQRKAKVARDAYALGAWDYKTQIRVANVAPGDLDQLTPVAFAMKYNLPFLNQLPVVAEVVA